MFNDFINFTEESFAQCESIQKKDGNTKAREYYVEFLKALFKLKNIINKCDEYKDKYEYEKWMNYVQESEQKIEQKISAIDIQISSEENEENKIEKNANEFIKIIESTKKTVDTSFQDVIGMTEEKVFMKLSVIIPITHPQTVKKGASKTNGCLLYGVSLNEIKYTNLLHYKKIHVPKIHQNYHIFLCNISKNQDIFILLYFANLSHNCFTKIIKNHAK